MACPGLLRLAVAGLAMTLGRWFLLGDDLVEARDRHAGLFGGGQDLFRGLPDRFHLVAVRVAEHDVGAVLGRAVATDVGAFGDEPVVQLLQRLERGHLPGEVVEAYALLVRALRLRRQREQRHLVRSVLAYAEKGDA